MADIQYPSGSQPNFNLLIPLFQNPASDPTKMGGIPQVQSTGQAVMSGAMGLMGKAKGMAGGGGGMGMAKGGRAAPGSTHLMGECPCCGGKGCGNCCGLIGRAAGGGMFTADNGMPYSVEDIDYSANGGMNPWIQGQSGAMAGTGLPGDPSMMNSLQPYACGGYMPGRAKGGPMGCGLIARAMGGSMEMANQESPLANPNAQMPASGGGGGMGGAGGGGGGNAMGLDPGSMAAAEAADAAHCPVGGPMPSIAMGMATGGYMPMSPIPRATGGSMQAQAGQQIDPNNLSSMIGAQMKGLLSKMGGGSGGGDPNGYQPMPGSFDAVTPALAGNNAPGAGSLGMLPQQPQPQQQPGGLARGGKAQQQPYLVGEQAPETVVPQDPSKPPYTVGQNGPEIVKPNEDSWVIPNPKTQAQDPEAAKNAQIGYQMLQQRQQQNPQGQDQFAALNKAVNEAPMQMYKQLQQSSPQVAPLIANEGIKIRKRLAGKSDLSKAKAGDLLSYAAKQMNLANVLRPLSNIKGPQREQLYQQLLPTIKQIDSGAPNKYNPAYHNANLALATPLHAINLENSQPSQALNSSNPMQQNQQNAIPRASGGRMVYEAPSSDYSYSDSGGGSRSGSSSMGNPMDSASINYAGSQGGALQPTVEQNIKVQQLQNKNLDAQIAEQTLRGQEAQAPTTYQYQYQNAPNAPQIQSDPTYNAQNATYQQGMRDYRQGPAPGAGGYYTPPIPPQHDPAIQQQNAYNQQAYYNQQNAVNQQNANAQGEINNKNVERTVRAAMRNNADSNQYQQTMADYYLNHGGQKGNAVVGANPQLSGGVTPDDDKWNYADKSLSQAALTIGQPNSGKYVLGAAASGGQRFVGQGPNQVDVGRMRDYEAAYPGITEDRFIRQGATRDQARQFMQRYGIGQPQGGPPVYSHDNPPKFYYGQAYTGNTPNGGNSAETPSAGQPNQYVMSYPNGASGRPTGQGYREEPTSSPGTITPQAGGGFTYQGPTGTYNPDSPSKADGVDIRGNALPGGPSGPIDQNAQGLQAQSSGPGGGNYVDPNMPVSQQDVQMGQAMRQLEDSLMQNQGLTRMQAVTATDMIRQGTPMDQAIQNVSFSPRGSLPGPMSEQQMRGQDQQIDNQSLQRYRQPDLLSTERRQMLTQVMNSDAAKSNPALASQISTILSNDDRLREGWAQQQSNNSVAPVPYKYSTNPVPSSNQGETRYMVTNNPIQAPISTAAAGGTPNGGSPKPGTQEATTAPGVKGKPLPPDKPNKVSPGQAGQATMMTVAEDSIRDIDQLVFEKGKDGTLDYNNPKRWVIANAQSAGGVMSGIGNIVTAGKSGELANRIAKAVDATLRVETGAQQSESEIKRQAQKYMPAPTDSPTTIKDKLNSLKMYVDKYKNLISSGYKADALNQETSPMISNTAEEIAKARGFKQVNGKWVKG